MAEAVLAHRLSKAGLDHLVSVESAGTGGWHVGRGADPRTRAALAHAGYDAGHIARQFQPSWFEQADLVLGMDYSNVQDLRGMAPDDDAAIKVLMLRSFDPAFMHLPEDDPVLEIPDPYYGGEPDFDEALAMIEFSVDGVIDYIRLHLPDSP